LQNTYSGAIKIGITSLTAVFEKQTGVWNKV